MELAQAGMADQVTSIRLLTGAMEVNNVIGHALEETPSRIKESKLLPPCDGMKSLKDWAYKQNKPFLKSFIFHIGVVLQATYLIQFNGIKQ